MQFSLAALAKDAKWHHVGLFSPTAKERTVQIAGNKLTCPLDGTKDSRLFGDINIEQ